MFQNTWFQAEQILEVLNTRLESSFPPFLVFFLSPFSSVFSLFFCSVILSFVYICGFITSKEKYQAASTVVLWILIALHFHQILSDFPYGKIISSVGIHSPLCVSGVIKSSEFPDQNGNPSISYYMQVLVFETLISEGY